MQAKQRSILVVVQNSPVPLSTSSPTLRIYSAGATKIPIPTCYTAPNSVVLLLRNGSLTSQQSSAGAEHPKTRPIFISQHSGCR